MAISSLGTNLIIAFFLEAEHSNGILHKQFSLAHLRTPGSDMLWELQ